MTKNPYKGKFIVFEGIDGSGTTTQSNLLEKYLKKQGPPAGEAGKKVFLTSEPSQNMIGGLIRSRLAGHWQSSAECLQILFAADRDYHLEKEIIPLLKRGITVICTRYILSSLAYGVVDDGDKKWLTGLNERFIWPNQTFLLKVSAGTSIQRIKKERFHEELFEKEDKLNKVARNYLNLAKDFPRVFIIDGEKSIKEVFEQVKKYL